MEKNVDVLNLYDIANFLFNRWTSNESLPLFHSFYIPNFLFYINSLGQLNMICILVFVRSLY